MKLPWKRLLVSWFAAFTLAACAGEGTSLHTRMDGMVGRATKRDFSRDWGPPVSQVQTEQGELWFYQSVLLQFDRKGILSEWHSHQH